MRPAPITAPFSVRMVWDEFVMDPIDPTDFAGDEIVARIRVRAHWEIKPLSVDNEHMSAATEQQIKEQPRGGGT